MSAYNSVDMIMTQNHRDIIGIGLTRGVLLVLVLALMMRGMIPSGYMPNTNAAYDSRAVITLCTGSNMLTIPLTELLGNAPHSQDALTGADCPFSLFSHEALNLPPLSAAPMRVIAASSILIPAISNTALPTSGSRGPPLGSRAPPLLF